METKLLEILKTIEKIDEETLNEWIGYLASLKSINDVNIAGRYSEYSDLVIEILNSEVGEDIIELNALNDDKKLADYIKDGYRIINANNNRITIAKNKKLSEEELIEILREEIRPYRTLYLQATRLDYDRVLAVLRESDICEN